MQDPVKEQYSTWAEHCFSQAEPLEDPADKAKWLMLAEAWRALAESNRLNTDDV